MIYVPDLTYKCYVLINKDTIRAYQTQPYNPGYNQSITINYRDYYINSNYLYTDGTQQFNNYTTLPICLDQAKMTDDFYYRNDFHNILIIFLIMSIFVFYIPYKLFSRIFGRWLRV